MAVHPIILRSPFDRVYDSLPTLTLTPDYVGERVSGTVSVIDTVTNTAVGLIPVGSGAFGVAVSPDGSKVYVANDRDNTVSVIATATNTVVSLPIKVGRGPTGVAVTPDGRQEGLCREPRRIAHSS